MKDKFKLKHLDVLIEEDKSKQDLALLMREIMGYKNSFFGKTKHFVKCFVQMKKLVVDIEKIDYDSIKLNEKSHINKPVSVDHICYSAMLNLQSFSQNENDLTMASHMAKVIAIATYEENKESDYKADSNSFNAYNKAILECNMFDMVGLYNWIIKDLELTSTQWQERFHSVEITDQDLLRAGGENLKQFNVINTIKTICSDFNCEESQAWRKSYYLIQSNSYSKAYSSFVQNNIKIQKEAEMKAKRLN